MKLAMTANVKWIMSRMNLLNTRAASFGDLIGNGKNYHIPKFQRDYSWDKDNWLELWEDIMTLQANPTSSYYMGALVLKNSAESSQKFQVIDGQQRLVTISILIIAVLEKIRSLQSMNIDVEYNQERSEILRDP